MIAEIKNQILDMLPYSEPFRFVDDIIEVDENSITGTYTFKKDEFFYKGHFTGNPVTPGVILIETMGQIGLVCLAAYISIKSKKKVLPLLSNVEAEFLLPVLPGEKVIVKSEKRYYRNNILNCKVSMLNVLEQEVARLQASLKIIDSEK